MKIISNFKDYYDYIMSKFGGGDPKILYIRNEIGDKIKTSNHGINNNISLFNQGTGFEFNFKNFNKPISYLIDGKKYTYNFKLVVVCGKGYVIYSTKKIESIPTIQEENWKLFLKKDFDQFKIDLYNKRNRSLLSWRPYFFKSDFESFDSLIIEVNKNKNIFIEISRKIKHPIFYLEYSYIRQDTIKISGSCPILKDLGFPSIISPEDMYQDIEHFMTNVINENPDTIPPVEIADKYKITQAGFDLKTSFRKPKQTKN